MMNRRFWLLLIILIAFALRLIALGEQSLWYDEGVTWYLAQKPLAELLAWTAADIQPPLYYLLSWSSQFIFGESEWALRFPAVVFNLLALPILYRLARRLFRPVLSPAPYLAMAIFAGSPLMVYYSQEARMYTLLVLEATLASYLLIKILLPLPSSSSPPYFLHLTSYSLTIAAALYTHYFAVFLLAIHLLFTAAVLWQRGWPKPLLAQTALMFTAGLGLFSPWLPTLLSRLGDDPSYWPGALKLDEAIRKVLISFSLGETVFEQTGLWLSGGYFGFLILSFGFWLLAKPKNRGGQSGKQAVFFLTLWLCLPISLILALSYQSPKFNPRYTLIAYPAFVLLVAALLAHLYGLQASGRSFVRERVSRFLFNTTLLFILATSLLSLHNWFTRREFQKDDFQALAQFVRERMRQDETVLLSSGHMFPVWAYYFGWHNWTPLPAMERLDVNQITNLTIAADINRAVAGQGGVWLVTWQNEVIDPNGVVPFWLDRIGWRPVDAGDFWGVGLEHWRLDPAKIERLAQSPIDHPARTTGSTAGLAPAGGETPFGNGYNFANHLQLLGLTRLADDDIALFWQVRRPLPDEVIITLDLIDSAGLTWSRNRLAGPLGSPAYPPSRWPVGEIILTRHHLPWRTGAPPGPYILEAGLGQAAPEFTGWDILDSQGRPQRRTALLPDLYLNRPVQPLEPARPANIPVIDLWPAIRLQESHSSESRVEPGDRLSLALLWLVGPVPAEGLAVTPELIDAGNHPFDLAESFRPGRQFPPAGRQQSGQWLLDQLWLSIPPEAAPGPARLQLHFDGAPADKTFLIHTLEILPTDRNFEPPVTVDVPLAVNFANQLTLLGLDCRPEGCQAGPGDTVRFTLYWQAEVQPDKNYTIFTHLLNAGETVLVNADHAPPKPMPGWVAGEIITDPVTLTLPETLPPGVYAVEIGLYDAADPAYPRLPRLDGDSRVLLPQLIEVK